MRNMPSVWQQRTTEVRTGLQSKHGHDMQGFSLRVPCSTWKKDVTIGDVNADEIEYAYAEMSGTSMAAPHVAAAAALVWSHFGSTCSKHQIRYALAHSALNPDATEEVKCDQNYGHGVVKAQDAYDFLLTHDCSTWDVALLSHGGCTTTSVVI